MTSSSNKFVLANKALEQSDSKIAKTNTILNEMTGVYAKPTDQLRQLLFTVKAVRRGDFSVRLPVGQGRLVY